MARIKTRILTDTLVEGVLYKTDQVVAFDDKHANQLEAIGVLDTSPAAVKYCIDELKAKPVEHAAKKPAADEAPTEPAAKVPGKGKK